MALGKVFQLVATCLCIWLGYKLLKRLRRAKLARSLGCKPPRRYPHQDPVFGIDLFLKTAKAIQGHFYLRELEDRYGSLGTTFATNFLGRGDGYQLDRAGELEGDVFGEFQSLGRRGRETPCSDALLWKRLHHYRWAGMGEVKGLAAPGFQQRECSRSGRA